LAWNAACKTQRHQSTAKRNLTLFPVIENTDAFDALAEEWDAVADAVCPGTPFARHAWFRNAWCTWFNGKKAALRVIRISNGTDHYGFLPLVVTTGPLRSLHSRQLKLLLPADHSTPVRLPIALSSIAASPELQKQLADTIESLSWDELSFDGLDQPEAEFFANWLKTLHSVKAGAQSSTRRSALCPVISMPDSWSEFHTQLSYNKRRELRRNESRLSALGNLSLKVISTPDEIDQEFTASINRARERYQRAGFKNGFDDEHFRNFHRESAKSCAADDQVRLFLLTLDQTTIASLYIFKEGDTYHAYQGGFAQEYASFGPGTLLDALAMRYGIETDRIRIFDFGYGEQDYKTRFTHALRSVFNLHVRRPRWAVNATNDQAGSIESHAGDGSMARGKKTLVLSIGHIAGVALGMLTPMILSRRFEVDDFGIYRQFLVIAWFIGLTAQFGMDSGLFYFVRKNPERASVFSLNTALFNSVAALLIGAALVSFSLPLANFLESPALAGEMPWVALYFVFALPGQHLPFYLLIRNRIKTATIFAIVNATANAVAAIVGCAVFGSVRAVIIGLTVWAAAKALWLLWLHGKDEIMSYVRNWLHDIRLMQQQIRFGLPIGMATLVTVAARLDRFMVSAFFGLRVFTGYSVGCFDLPVLPNVFDSMSGLMVTDMVKRGESGNIDALKRERVTSIWLSTVSQILILLVPAVIFSIVFADTMIVAFFSEKYRSSAGFFQIYMLSFFLLYLDPDHVFQGLARTKISFKINLAGAVISLVAMFVGMEHFGVTGILIGRVAGEALTTAMRFVILSFLLRINALKLIPWKNFILLFLASAIAAKMTKIVVDQLATNASFIRLLVAAGVFGSTYAMFGMLLGVLKIKTVIALIRRQPVEPAPATD
jgi:O-antigen/teichoic acid export membrane protein